MLVEVLLVIVLVCIVYTWKTTAWKDTTNAADKAEQMHGVKCVDKAFAGGPGYRATCSRGHYLPTTYHVDTKWNSDVNSSRNMNYSYTYWNGIKLASCDECPTPYVCKECPKYLGAGEGYFDDANKIRGINEEINIGEDEKAPSVHGEFFGPSPIYTDGAPMIPPRPPIDNIGPLASNAYEIAKQAQRNRYGDSRYGDTMAGDRGENFRYDLISPAPMRFTASRTLLNPPPMGSENMSVSGHDEVYHGHHGEFIGEDMNTGPACAEDLYYEYTQNYAADSVGEISRELHASAIAKPRAVSMRMDVESSQRDQPTEDAAGLSLRKHASTAGCRRSTATTAAKLLYSGVMGLHNPPPDLGQCEYLRPNGYVYQEPCSFSA